MKQFIEKVISRIYSVLVGLFFISAFITAGCSDYSYQHDTDMCWYMFIITGAICALAVWGWYINNKD